MKERIYLNNLYDIYGELLDSKKKEYFEMYYFDNLSLQEISDNLGVSRKAIFKQIKNDDFSSIVKYGIIQERTSSLFTDALRANILELQGYRTQILEFIDIEHTPKNLLIRAIKTGSPQKDWAKVDNFVEKFSIDPTLYRLLRGNKNEK